MFDTHMHSRFSCDSEMLIEEAISKAESIDLGMILTEHMDIDYPDNPEAFLFDVEAYFHTYLKYRSERVLLGIEIGLQLSAEEENKRIITTYPFDFVIGSIHVANKIDVYSKNFYDNKTKQQAYIEYFNAMFDSISRFSDFDSLGHIDYICRYAPYKDTEIYYEEYRDQIDQVLKTLVEKDKAMEINTRRINEKSSLKSLLPIYRRFSELGGQYVTIGSDAHRHSEVGRRIDIATTLAEQAGLTVVYYKNRTRMLDK